MAACSQVRPKAHGTPDAPDLRALRAIGVVPTIAGAGASAIVHIAWVGAAPSFIAAGDYTYKGQASLYTQGVAKLLVMCPQA